MKIKIALKKTILSIDFIIPVIIVLVIATIAPSRISIFIAKEIFSVSVSVLSIVFSVFFAALAIVITAGDNEFVNFLEEDNTYTRIIWTFKFTLLLLFISLIASIVLFVTVIPYTELVAQSNVAINLYYPEWLILIFGLIATWSLFAAANSSLSAIKYAEKRAKYIEIMSMTVDDIKPRIIQEYESENDS